MTFIGFVAHGQDEAPYIGKYFLVWSRDFENYKATYPALSILSELRMMEAWLDANPRRRKKNYKRFITNWLKAEQRKAAASQVEARVGSGPSDSGAVIRLKKKVSQ